LVELIEGAERFMLGPESDIVHRKALSVRHFLMGLQHKLRGDSENEMSSYEVAVEIFPENASAHRCLAGMLEKKGRRAEAMKQYRIAADLYDAQVPEKESKFGMDPADYHKIGVTHADNWKIAVERNPIPSAYKNLADALRDIGRLDEAVAAYKKAVELDPNDVWLHYTLSKTLEKQGNQDEAKKCRQIFNDLVKPNSGAEVDKKRVAAIDHYLHGLVHSLDGKTDDQLLAFEKAVDADPDDYTLQKSLAELLEKKGRIDEAKEHYRIAADLCEAGDCKKKDVCEEIADLCQRMNETLARISQKVVENNPNSDAYTDLGVALRDIGRLDDAVAAMKKSIELRPTAIFAYYELAKTLEKQGNNDEAGKYMNIFRDSVQPKTAAEKEAAK
jgi:superkiller protein 3